MPRAARLAPATARKHLGAVPFVWHVLTMTNALKNVADLSQHVFMRTANYTLEGHVYDTKSLVITFENAAIKDQDNPLRLGWGAKRFRAQRTSHLCIKPAASDWYQHPDLAVALTDLRDAGFFSQFRHRLTYGGSMGGFAALVYADLVQATCVLAMNPQSTLDPAKADWDRRFPDGRAQDWSGPFADARGLARTPKAVVVVYDPFVAQDAQHIGRLDQPTLIKLRGPFLGHGMAVPLTRMKRLGPLLHDAMHDTVRSAVFYQGLRQRKLRAGYYGRMIHHPYMWRSLVSRRGWRLRVKVLATGLRRLVFKSNP